MIKFSSLTLQNFRNFASRQFCFDSANILFSGENGAGKTNILEALNLFGRANNSRLAKLSEMLKIENGDFLSNQFRVAASLVNHQFIDDLEISYEANTAKKTLLINGEEVLGKKRSDFKNYLPNCILLNPELEQLFIGDKAKRRDYLDKIVGDLDLSHQSRIASYEKLLRERLNFLQQSNFSQSFRVQNSDENCLENSAINSKTAASAANFKRRQSWLEVVENQIVELGTAIAAARLEAIDFFNRAIASFASNFPKILLQVEGEVEEMMKDETMLKIEEIYRQKMAENRDKDCLEGRTNFGIHRCDFDAIFLPKNMPITICSTGEQKAAMISVTLARAKISSAYKNLPTILLFDEVASHLDLQRKERLFEEIYQTGLQNFFTATSVDLIPQKFSAQMQVFELKN